MSKVIKDHGAPDVNTNACLGDFYEDVDTGAVYKLVDINYPTTTIGGQFAKVNYHDGAYEFIWESCGGSGNSGGIPAIVPKTAVIMEGSGPTTYGEIIIDNFVPFINGNKYLVLCCDSIAEVASVYTAEALETGTFVDLNIEIGDNPMTVRANIEDRYYTLEGLADDGETVTIGVYGPVTI